MTYIIAIKCEWAGKQAILVAADRQSSRGDKTEIQSHCKIYEIDTIPALFTAAGSLPTIQLVQNIFNEEMKEYIQDGKEFLLNNDFYGFLWTRAKRLEGIDLIDWSNQSKRAEFLIWASDYNNKVGLYKYGPSYVEECHDTPGYVTAGSGHAVGGARLFNMYFPFGQIPTLDQAAEIAIMIISTVATSPYSGGVSAEYDLYATSMGKIGKLSKGSKKQLIRIVEERREIIRLMWFLSAHSGKWEKIKKIAARKIKNKLGIKALKKKKILIIDDEIKSESPMGKELTALLKPTDLELRFANDGTEGIELAISDKDVSLVLLDHEFKNQEKQGPSIYKSIKKKRPSIPIIGLSKYSRHEREFNGSGSLLFIQKERLKDSKEILLALAKDIDEFKYEWTWS